MSVTDAVGAAAAAMNQTQVLPVVKEKCVETMRFSLHTLQLSKEHTQMAATASTDPTAFVVVVEFCNYEYTWSLHSVSVFTDESECDRKIAELTATLRAGAWRITKSTIEGPHGTIPFEGNEDPCDIGVLSRTTPELRVVNPRNTEGPSSSIRTAAAAAAAAADAAAAAVTPTEEDTAISRRIGELRFQLSRLDAASPEGQVVLRQLLELLFPKTSS
jgi:hypothetical protein